SRSIAGGGRFRGRQPGGASSRGRSSPAGARRSTRTHRVPTRRVRWRSLLSRGSARRAPRYRDRPRRRGPGWPFRTIVPASYNEPVLIVRLLIALLATLVAATGQSTDPLAQLLKSATPKYATVSTSVGKPTLTQNGVTNTLFVDITPNRG